MGAGAGRPGLQTAPGLIVYRYGADLFYANADRFADEVRELVEKAPTPVKWLVFDAEAIADVDLSAAQTVRSPARRSCLAKAFASSSGASTRICCRTCGATGIAEAVGEGRIFPTLHEALDAIRAEGWSPGSDAANSLVIR